MGDSAADVCPHPDRDLNSDNRKIGLLVFVLGVVFFAAGLTWWAKRRSHPLLRKRNFGLIVLSTIGLCACLVWSELFLIFGPDDVPCDAFLWLTLLLVPLGMGPTVARMYAFKNRATFAALLQDELVGVELGGRAHMFRRPGLLVLIRAYLSPYRCTRGRSEIQVGIDVKMDREGNVFEREDSKLDKVVHDESVLEEIRAAYFAQSDAMGLLVTAIFSAPGMLIAAVRSGSKDGPFGKDCYGCGLDDDILEPVLIQAVVFASLGLIALFWLRNAPDPLHLLRDIRFCWLCMCVFGSSLALSYIDPGDLRASGDFDWTHVGAVALLVLFAVQCPLQVFYTYRLRAGAITLNDIDQNQDLKDDFELFVEGAFFPETIAFLEATGKFKDAHERAAGREALQRANQIHDVFLADDSIISLNLSMEKIQRVRIALHGARGTRDNLFDELLDELEDEVFTKALLPLFMPSSRLVNSSVRLVDPHAETLRDDEEQGFKAAATKAVQKAQAGLDKARGGR
ncbi:Hypothetical Protein FCC1311_015232 [Hondaea fermentalgiana]|uniref:RGS domain-containing protein n=1 Tax=Hondaea fermentalgiana TaxID=2315210 RepID=A0A2R5G2Q5_9STRA|nr:Hypothetical Protein FCC1311_015232 [Hondaea fermentalgiana]|eukprot:GBG25306.1 Hypothetical Protein FCC1311_015232 [Hondaea fermentalgiana]